MSNTFFESITYITANHKIDERIFVLEISVYVIVVAEISLIEFSIYLCENKYISLNTERFCKLGLSSTTELSAEHIGHRQDKKPTRRTLHVWNSKAEPTNKCNDNVRADVRRRLRAGYATLNR